MKSIKQLKLDFNERSDYPTKWLEGLELGLDSLWLYPDKSNLQALIAEQHKLEPEQVFCTNGGDEAIYLLMRIIKETSKLILPLPAFSQYTWGLDNWSIDTLLIQPNKDLTIDWPALLLAIQQQPNSTVILTTPNNPTGESLSLAQIEQVLSLCQENSSTLFLDEAYIEFSDVPSAKCLLKEYDNLIILRTLSKAFGLAGIRLGYLLSNSSLLEEFNSRCIPFNVPTLTLQVAELALSKKAQQDTNQYIEQIKANRVTLCNWLNDNNIDFTPCQGNFVLIRTNETRASFIKQSLAKNNIKVRCFEDELLKGCVRITIPYYLDPLLDALMTILRPELICFDMDGVLIDTSSSYDNAIKATVKYFTDATVTDQDIRSLRSQGGFNNDWVLAQELVKQQGKDIDLAAITETFQQYYLGDSNNGFIANEKVLVDPALTEQLSTINVAVVTGRPKAEANTGAEMIGWSDRIVVSDDDVSQSKPSPEGILKVKQQLNNKQSWMLGDTPDDMQAAIDSDSLAIGVGLANKQSLYQAGAYWVVDSVNDIKELLA
ncbi:MAG: aminotransferase class I/II-fold pyridoxal phosphate-dependent enzyme [Kangiellaceae bacterium]|jgi:histidinol-phosphate aminotransferase|nr:aminotransferase class I/II-fold pyridoxal phosphate-dependent enzyme [Kangiellaceae bacterium]